MSDEEKRDEVEAHYFPSARAAAAFSDGWCSVEMSVHAEQGLWALTLKENNSILLVGRNPLKLLKRAARTIKGLIAEVRAAEIAEPTP